MFTIIRLAFLSTVSSKLFDLGNAEEMFQRHQQLTEDIIAIKSDALAVKINSANSDQLANLRGMAKEDFGDVLKVLEDRIEVLRKNLRDRTSESTRVQDEASLKQNEEALEKLHGRPWIWLWIPAAVGFGLLLLVGVYALSRRP